ncbi:hypothetical protein EVAR_96900_1 [Eumeta japonica]|uniref:Uncharacterized protein n=1 Tax=Eumeta variegata TaxID=151549 RepID=A0A4C1WET2_EUMVA|nr:hypothetical protein EVAR_96900_1 [Eumeta japonica]
MACGGLKLPIVFDLGVSLPGPAPEYFGATNICLLSLRTQRDLEIGSAQSGVRLTSGSARSALTGYPSIKSGRTALGALSAVRPKLRAKYPTETNGVTIL